jgi:hypothetical protein
VPLLVGRAGECLQPVEARRRARDRGCRAYRDLREDTAQPAQILLEVRRSPDDQPSPTGHGGRLHRHLPTLDFKPAVHVNYAETVLPIRDGLPKLKDFPKEFGGSGEAIAE